MTITLVRPRHGDVSEAAEDVRAVDLGGFVQLAGDGLQAGQEHHRPERRAGPDDGDDDRPQRQVVVAQPLDQLAGEAEPQREHVEQADRAAVVHPLPGQAGDQRRDRPRQEEDGADERAARETLVAAAAPWTCPARTSSTSRPAVKTNETLTDGRNWRAQVAADRAGPGSSPARPSAGRADELGLEAEQDRRDERVGDQADHDHDRHGSRKSQAASQSRPKRRAATSRAETLAAAATRALRARICVAVHLKE